MKHWFATLSFGKNYTTDYTLRFIDDILRLTPASVAVTTDLPEIITDKFNTDRVFINKMNRDDYKIRLPIGPGKHASDFNFNMRHICLKPFEQLEADVVYFTDCDNSIRNWNTQQIEAFLDDKINQGYGFFAPRADLRLGPVKREHFDKIATNPQPNIFWHKIKIFDLEPESHKEWDDAPLPAEYLLILHNKDNKVMRFYEEWKKLHDYLCNKDFTYGTWAEGFEIGVAAHLAGLKPYDIQFCGTLLSDIVTPNGYKIGHPTEH
jgi:hypothetical protein